MVFVESISAQDISLYNQFSGRYDFMFIGNTLNPQENSFMLVPEISTTSSAQLTLNSGDTIFKAYLFWAGCGPGDFTIQMNDLPITAERTFYYERYRLGNLNQYFSAFADVTSIVQTIGEGTFTVSDLDVTEVLNYYFNEGGKTNFAGWSLLLITENADLPLNQINIYDGMQAVPSEISIDLDNLNVVDKIGAKIGFIAWEGDADIANNETLKINDVVLANSLNPPDNAFNGTNTFTNSTNLFNMDLDVYDIQDYISVDNDFVTISLTSDQDLVMVNAIVTKLNNQLPDATITIDFVETRCGSQDITANYTVYNLNSTDVLPANVPISIFVNESYVTTLFTTQPLSIGEQYSSQTTFSLPENTPLNFELLFVVDQNTIGNGTIVELDETNNNAIQLVEISPLPQFNLLPTLYSCNLSFGSGIFDFSIYAELVKVDSQHSVSFFSTHNDAQNNSNQIYNTAGYTTQQSPTIVYVRITDTNGCSNYTNFILQTRNCPPTVYNYVSANNDGVNDTFYIEGLRNIFLDFKIEIYNRWGVLLWTGNQNSPDWNGTTTVSSIGIETVPDGTYFYVIHLNDVHYPNPLKGYLYFKN